MIIYRDYNEDAGLDRVWYTSSSVIYSECDDKKDSLKTLRVTFKNGSTYEYYDVDVNDYVMFVHGGTDGSNGKALHKFIKGKYDFKRIEDKDPIEIQNDLDRLRAKKEE